MELAIAILGIAGTVIDGASKAIAAARAGNEAEAFAILDQAIKDAAGVVSGLAAQIEANKKAALDELAEKFPKDEEPTKP